MTLPLISSNLSTISFALKSLSSINSQAFIIKSPIPKEADFVSIIVISASGYFSKISSFASLALFIVPLRAEEKAGYIIVIDKTKN